MFLVSLSSQLSNFLHKIFAEEDNLMMQLSHYPAVIVQAAQRVNEIDSQLMAVQQQINRFEGNADRIAAFEIDLKNDAQRKARRFEVLLVNQEYQKAMDTLMRLTSDKANAIAHLEYLRNQFSVAKLEARLAIAQQLTDFESRELVGL
ncbi:hypothetical protein Cal7507_4584 [Calothrix sp. PCC 7507]|nr:hypothetical protein Cal7507_4584 [Calothrix sp. PCC 7507]